MSAEILLERMRQGLDQTLIDVRSELEFTQGALPLARNLPILTQEERHQVGICYKQKGQAAAILLGHELVDPLREERVAAWRAAIKQAHEAPGLLMCWRGGLRSQIAGQWLKEAGIETERVEGGYKAVRHLLLDHLRQKQQLLLLGGMTGSGKTELLQLLPRSQVDLEGAARHRGSAFGAALDQAQPSQASFENHVSLQLMKAGSLAILEDESRVIGRLKIPEELFQHMRLAPMVLLEDSLESRVHRIYREYVAEPLMTGMAPALLQQTLVNALLSLRRRLDRHFNDLFAAMNRAFQTGSTEANHSVWISALLEIYYDPSYRYAMAQASHPIVFQGSRLACRDYLVSRLAGVEEAVSC